MTHAQPVASAAEGAGRHDRRGAADRDRRLDPAPGCCVAFGIVIGTLSWLLAAWAAFPSATMRPWWAAPAAPGGEHFVGGYLGVGIGVMIVVAVIGMVIKAMIHRSMLTSLDRLLGGVLGAVRGGLIAAILVLLAGSPADRRTSWQRSAVRPC
jgi:membrane protein required for colicin V production